jgi:hypothetical protein
MEMMPDLSAASVKMLVSDTLRMFVGHGRRISWADLAAATGDEERKLRSYVETGGSVMPFDVAARVFTALPPEAFARVAGRMGYGVAPLDVAPDVALRRGLAQAARFVADGNDYLEDGRLCPREQADLQRAAADLLPVIQSLAGNGSGGP